MTKPLNADGRGIQFLIPENFMTNPNNRNWDKQLDMTQPKNPKCSTCGRELSLGVDRYVAGLAAGEKRLARALREWGNHMLKVEVVVGWFDVESWLTTRARAKRRKP